MNVPRPRRPLAMTFALCLRRNALPVLLAAVLGALVRFAFGSPLAGLDAAPGANTPWLHLPLLVAAFGCAAAAATFWPVFAARRPGRDQVARLQRGPLRGCGAVIAGALLAQFVLTWPLVAVCAPLLGAPAAATAHFELSVPPQPLLDAGRPRLSFAVAGRVLDEIRLRPLAAPPTGPWQPTRVQVRLDGEGPAVADVVFAENLQLARVPLSPRAVHRIDLEFVAGSVPLLFLRGSVVAVEAGARSGLANSALAAAACLLPGFVALAFALLFGTAAGLPTVLAAIGGLLFVQTIGGAGPADAAVLALLRGRWLPTELTFSACVPSLAAGSVAMIAAMLLRRRSGR